MTLQATSSLHIDKSPEAQEFYSMLPNFWFTLGRNETLSKMDFIKRIKSMFSLESDPRNKYFVDMAERTSFLSIYRDITGEKVNINF